MVALEFLTVLSLPFRRRASFDVGPSAAHYFTLVGLLLGLILAGADILLSAVFPPAVVGALLVALMVILTGALHLDGFMDTCDGVFYRGEPERRLEIMRDSRVGAFGVVGLATLLLVKYSALMSLPLLASASLSNLPVGVLSRPSALVLMAMASRLAMAYCLVFFPYARSAGLGKLFQGRRSVVPLFLNTSLVGLMAYSLLGIPGVLSILASGLAVWLGALYIMSKIPGLTGDSYGALGEVAEITILLVLVIGR